MTRAKHNGHLRPDPKNARKHSERNKALIRQSLEAVGGFRSIAVDGQNIIRAGNGVFEQAQDLGLKVRVIDAKRDELIAVRRRDLKGKEAIRAAALDNLAADTSYADYDAEILASIARDDDLIAQLAREDKAISALLAKAEPQAEKVDPSELVDKAAELQKKWQVKRGDIWEIGKHRIMCGDSTSREDVERLMEGPVAITFTDPPYNALKSWKKDEARGETRLDPSHWFQNDNMEWPDYEQFLTGAFESLNGHSVYVCCDYRIYPRLVPLIEAYGYTVRHCIVWKKNVWGLGKRYRFQHEFIIYACKGNAPFYGMRDESDVWDVNVERGEHNTPKPVALPYRAIRNSSKVKEGVLDLFLGSGTTLVACEQTGRIGRGMEIEPRYVAVCLERLVNLGLKAKRLESSTMHK